MSKDCKENDLIFEAWTRSLVNEGQQFRDLNDVVAHVVQLGGPQEEMVDLVLKTARENNVSTGSWGMDDEHEGPNFRNKVAEMIQAELTAAGSVTPPSPIAQRRMGVGLPPQAGMGPGPGQLTGTAQQQTWPHANPKRINLR